MLLNNFKPLLFFGNNGTFKDVNGDTRDLLDFIGGSDNETVNNHTHFGTMRSFDYTTTTGSNSYTDEQGVYTWFGVTVSSYGDDADSRRMNGFTLFVGSGNTAVTANDFKLANAVTLDVTAASCNQRADGKVITSRSFLNNTGSDVTIRELGLYMFKPIGDSYKGHIIMLGRKVLPTPVVIPDGEQRTFEYVIDMNNISFSDLDE